MHMSYRFKLCALAFSTVLFSSQVWAEPAQWSLGADYTNGFVANEPVASFALSYQQKMSALYGVYASQGVAKNFWIDSSREEWEPADLVLGIAWYPQTLIPPLTWLVRTAMTLPSSRSSRNNEIYSRPEVSSTANFKAHDTLKLAASGFARYTWSAYETTKGINGVGGDPLPHYSYGLSVSGLQELPAGFRFQLKASYFETKYYRMTDEGAQTLPLLGQPEQGYSISAFILSTLTEQWGLHAGLIQGSLLEQPGLSDYLLFDEEATTWGMGVDYSF